VPPRYVTALVLALAMAGGPRFAGADDPPGQPITGDAGWRLLPPPAACAARRERGPGDNVDTMVLLNKAGKPVLAVGSPDWSFAGVSEQKIQLRIDSATPKDMSASFGQNLVLVVIDDRRMLRQLRGAERLTWTLPSGLFSADVTGLGAAIDAAAACRKAGPGAVQSTPTT
jgi:hypothetical protein